MTESNQNSASEAPKHLSRVFCGVLEALLWLVVAAAVAAAYLATGASPMAEISSNGLPLHGKCVPAAAARSDECVPLSQAVWPPPAELQLLNENQRCVSCTLRCDECKGTHVFMYLWIGVIGLSYVGSLVGCVGSALLRRGSQLREAWL